MKNLFALCATFCFVACGTTTSASSADDTTATDGTVAGDDTATGDTTSTADTATTTDTAANTCKEGISLSGGPAFMTSCFVHNDTVNPKPVELKADGHIAIEFTQRGAAAPDTLILTVVWDAADATSLLKVNLATGHSDYTSFDTTSTCGLGCKATSQGVEIDATKRTISFTKTVVSHYNPYGASYDTPVTLNGTLAY